MNDRHVAPWADLEDAGQTHEAEQAEVPDGKTQWPDIDDMVWDAFGSGLSGAYD